MKEAKNKRRDHIDSVRVMLWYAYIEQNLKQARGIRHRIERIIEPEAFGRTSNDCAYHRNKWIRYQIGKHTPHPSLVDSAEFHVSGSTKILNSVLWEAIRGHKELNWFIRHGVGQLSLDVQRILYKTNKYQSSSTLVSALSSGDLRRLEQLAELDSLAAQVIFLRIADSRNEREKALEIGKSIYRTLLIICTAKPFFNFGTVLMSLLVSCVLPLAHDGSKRIYFENEDVFFNKVKELNEIFLALEDKGLVGVGRKDAVKLLSGLLHGKFGFDLIFVFAAPVSILEDLENHEE